MEGQGSLIFVFLLALLMTYMVLASQFESFTDPLTILFAVPLAIAGALVTLWVYKMTLNIYSMIGLVMLIGLSAKNSILLVDFANQERARGLELFDATIRAGAVRLRPILMTAISTIIGAVPIAFSLGAGSVSRKPLGMAIVGGMAISTILTLFLIPVIYTLVVQFTGFFRGKK
jgi:multidrug efflux pump